MISSRLDVCVPPQAEASPNESTESRSAPCNFKRAADHREPEGEEPTTVEYKRGFKGLNFNVQIRMQAQHSDARNV